MDKLLGGGFGKGFLIEVAGNAGTFKSTFALQFAVEGIRDGERVSYISLEESKESFDILASDLNVSQEFSKVDFQNIEVAELMNLWHSSGSGGIASFVKRLLAHVDKANRLVIDTTTTTALYSSRTEAISSGGGGSAFVAPSLGDMRVMLFFLATEIRKMGCTALLLAESGEGDLYHPEQMLQYLCDGKIELKRSSLGTRTPRTIVIQKMRHTDHTLDEQPIVLTKAGLSVEEIEQG